MYYIGIFVCVCVWWWWEIAAVVVIKFWLFPSSFFEIRCVCVTRGQNQKRFCFPVMMCTCAVQRSGEIGTMEWKGEGCFFIAEEHELVRGEKRKKRCKRCLRKQSKWNEDVRTERIFQNKSTQPWIDGKVWNEKKKKMVMINLSGSGYKEQISSNHLVSHFNCKGEENEKVSRLGNWMFNLRMPSTIYVRVCLHTSLGQLST